MFGLVWAVFVSLTTVSGGAYSNHCISGLKWTKKCVTLIRYRDGLCPNLYRRRQHQMWANEVGGFRAGVVFLEPKQACRFKWTAGAHFYFIDKFVPSLW